MSDTFERKVKLKHKFILAASLAVILSVSAFATTVSAATTSSTQSAVESSTGSTQKCEKGKKEKVAEPENAIGKDKAKAAALKETGITEDKAEKIKSRVTKLEDGTVVYKVSFTSGDKYYSIKVNALTGAVAEKKEQSAEEHASLKTHSKSDSTKTTASTENAKS